MKYRTIINSEIKEALCSIKTANFLKDRKNGKQVIYRTFYENFHVLLQRVFDLPAGLKFESVPGGIKEFYIYVDSKKKKQVQPDPTVMTSANLLKLES
jgi:hypothetical protein